MSVPKDVYKSFKSGLNTFLSNIQQEKEETKEAFKILVKSIESGVDLTPEEKHQIGEQMKDVLKTIGIIGVAILPGGTIVLILTKLLKLNKYILPSSFDEKKVE